MSVTKELLYSYFAGTATVLQKQMIETWLKDPLNEAFFYTCLDAWEKDHLQYHTDVQDAIARFHNSITAQPVLPANTGADRHKPKISYVYLKRWLVAASLLFLLGTSAYLFRDDILYKKYFSRYGSITAVTLSDGSKVMLNSNSCLKVPRFDYNKDYRKVYLTGEASFSVVHTYDNKRFVVQTDSLFRLEVLGTEFTVFARARQTKVVLLKGKVKVQYGQENRIVQTVTMAPGDLVRVDKKHKQIGVEKVARPENYIAWKKGRFVFENTSLEEITAIVLENYGLTVKLQDDDLANLTVSGSFKAESADEFLQGISEVLDINVSRQNDHVILTGRK